MNHPPLGLRPKFIMEELRIQEITAAMDRYIDATLPIPIEWMDELHELYMSRKERRLKQTKP